MGPEAATTNVPETNVPEDNRLRAQAALPPRPGDPAGMDPSDAARIWLDIEQAPEAARAMLQQLAGVRGSPSGATAPPTSGLDPRWVKGAGDHCGNPAAHADKILSRTSRNQ